MVTGLPGDRRDVTAAGLVEGDRVRVRCTNPGHRLLYPCRVVHPSVATAQSGKAEVHLHQRVRSARSRRHGRGRPRESAAAAQGQDERATSRRREQRREAARALGAAAHRQVHDLHVVNAPGFGGISWLAHSTLQSGVWANTGQRYNELVSSDRFTLSDAFNRAGWRTINFAPADDDHWTDGSSYYHYAKLYDRTNMGYHGPGYNYAPVPDQYMFAALQRLELAKAHRQPLFAEVDTVSSHMPWDRIPQMIRWNKVGNGSIFNRIPTLTEPGSFWWHPNQVKAAYARSLEYSLNTLISYVQHYGKKNLVLAVVGDEQPLAIVSGQHAGHNVPISIIAHDPSVLKRISGWDWQSGLLPSPHAPVLRMSEFRDRFLTAYGPQPASR